MLSMCVAINSYKAAEQLCSNSLDKAFNANHAKACKVRFVLQQERLGHKGHRSVAVCLSSTVTEHRKSQGKTIFKNKFHYEIKVKQFNYFNDKKERKI
jgi:hypothetical protein